MSCSPGKAAVLDIVCGSLSASLCVKNLYNGSSRCVLLGSVVLTPCEFERRAGRGSTKNWKKSIRYCGRPLGEFWSRILVRKEENVLSLFRHLLIIQQPRHPGIQICPRHLMTRRLLYSLVLL